MHWKNEIEQVCMCLLSVPSCNGSCTTSTNVALAPAGLTLPLPQFLYLPTHYQCFVLLPVCSFTPQTTLGYNTQALLMVLSLSLSLSLSLKSLSHSFIPLHNFTQIQKITHKKSKKQM